LYINNVLRESAISQGVDTATIFTLPAPFQAGDQISCAMTVCGMPGKPSTPVTVTLEPPRPPVLMDPPTGANHVLLQPALIWQDPGQGTPGAATSFHVVVTTGSIPVIDTTVASTTYTSPVALAYKTSYQWTVTSINGGGQASAASAFAFSTELPPAASLKFVPPMKTSVAGNVFVRDQTFQVSVEVINPGNAASGPYTVEFTETLLATGHGIAMPFSQSMPPLAAGATATASSDAYIDSASTHGDTVRIDALLLVNNQQVDDVFLDG
jgi:hypothetical protein